MPIIVVVVTIPYMSVAVSQFLSHVSKVSRLNSDIENNTRASKSIPESNVQDTKKIAMGNPGGTLHDPHYQS